MHGAARWGGGAPASGCSGCSLARMREAAAGGAAAARARRPAPHEARRAGLSRAAPPRAQLFTRGAARRLYPSQRLQRWCFDVELLLLAQTLGVPVAETSVTWTEIPGAPLPAAERARHRNAHLLLRNPGRAPSLQRVTAGC